MNNQKRMKSFVFLGAMLLFAGIYGCQNDLGLNSQFDLSDLGTDDFAVADYYDVEANIQDATIESDMSMKPVFNNKNRFDRRGGYRGGRGGHLGGILRQLGVTEEQGAAIKDLIAAHRESVKEAFEGLRAANQDIIDEAKAQRQEILAAMRNGDITREEAKEQLKEYSQNVREAIADNPESAPYLEAICEAKITLFDNIRSLFDESQQTAWDEWVAGLDGMCFGNEG